MVTVVHRPLHPRSRWSHHLPRLFHITTSQRRYMSPDPMILLPDPTSAVTAEKMAIEFTNVRSSDHWIVNSVANMSTRRGCVSTVSLWVISPVSATVEAVAESVVHNTTLSCIFRDSVIPLLQLQLHLLQLQLHLSQWHILMWLALTQPKACASPSYAQPW